MDGEPDRIRSTVWGEIEEILRLHPTVQAKTMFEYPEVPGAIPGRSAAEFAAAVQAVAGAIGSGARSDVPPGA